MEAPRRRMHGRGPVGDDVSSANNNTICPALTLAQQLDSNEIILRSVDGSLMTKYFVVIAISCIFFFVELAIGFSTHSLAMIADAFHCLTDLMSFVVAVVALKLVRVESAPAHLPFGWQRSEMLGAFFNGVFLLALGVSIFLQAIERFILPVTVQNPLLVLIVGCVGVGVNTTMAVILGVNHGHNHGSSHDCEKAVDVDLLESGIQTDIPNDNADDQKLGFSSFKHKLLGNFNGIGTQAVALHLMADAMNNFGVIIAAAVMQWSHAPARFYADPAISMLISIMIVVSAVQISRRSAISLLCSAPSAIDQNLVCKSLENTPGVRSVHSLTIWQLNETESVVTCHVVLEPNAWRKQQSDHEKVEVDGTANDLLRLISSALQQTLPTLRIYSLTIQLEELDLDMERMHCECSEAGIGQSCRQSAKEHQVGFGGADAQWSDRRTIVDTDHQGRPEV